MARGSMSELPTVDDWSDVPAFANDAEEAEFWATHGLGGAALESLGTLDDDALPAPRPKRPRFWRHLADSPQKRADLLRKPDIYGGHARLIQAELAHAP